MKIKFYGNGNETVMEKDGKFYLIQSVDFHEAEQHEELSQLPEDITELNMSYSEIEIPVDLQ